jgi:hypothetical protein
MPFVRVYVWGIGFETQTDHSQQYVFMKSGSQGKSDGSRDDLSCLGWDVLSLGLSLGITIFQLVQKD